VKVRASILIPAHNRAETLELAVESCLAQTVAEVEVLIVGDGVTDAVRLRSGQLAARDGRVRFFDHPKGPHHGEIYRDDAIRAARSDAIFYLCDDDLLMPDHVADLLALLETKNFVQSLNGRIRPDGVVSLYVADLSKPRTIEWHVREDFTFNSVSITGTAHSRAFYETVGRRWETTPEGWWPDHYQWVKLMRHPEFAGATSSRMTTLQFPTTQDGRADWTDEARLAELRRWAELAKAADGQERIDALTHAGMLAQLEEEREALASLRHEVATLHSEVLRITGSVSWRLTRPLRAVRRLWPR
jgi:hypothetical protein